MRLTNTIKEAFVKAVGEALPKIDRYEEQDAQHAIQQMYYALLPAEVVKLNKKYPGLLAMRSKTFRLDKEEGYTQVYPVIPVMLYDTEVDISEIAANYRAYLAAIGERKALLKHLRAAADRCNTVSQLEQAYPDLAKYIPKVEPKAYALVTGDIVKSLKEAGLK